MASPKSDRPEDLTRDQASHQAIDSARAAGLQTVWDRYQQMAPQCSFAVRGVCCHACHMGPCRIVPKKSPVAICGADADTIVARNYVREICGGTAAHSDHARQLVRLLGRVGAGSGYTVEDEQLLARAAAHYGVSADQLVGALQREFGDSERVLRTVQHAPEKTIARWEQHGLLPRGIDSSVVEMMHRTTMGVDHDYRHLVLGGMRAALADGWGGSMIATLVTDLLFGTPAPVRSQVNLGVLKADRVNIVVHGHEPAVSEMLVLAARDEDLRALARSRGARGIQLAGICCTANEILMRHGIPIAGSFLQQELALATGAVELMIVDVQCVMPALAEFARCHHTRVVTTSHLAKMPDVDHVELDPATARESARELVRAAIDNFPQRNPERVCIPEQRMDLVAGFSNDAIFQMLGGRFRRSYRPLNDAIIQGRIRGVCGVVGCSTPKVATDNTTVTLVNELIRNDVLVLQTGCAAIACAKDGLLTPEAALERAGPGLREVCEAVGIPPVLHMGSCVDNSRLLRAATYLVAEGGLGESIADLPIAGCAPEWMSEKAVAIGSYFVASGIYTVLGQPLFTAGSENVTRLLCGEMEQITGGKFAYISDPLCAAASILEHIDGRRAALGIDREADRKLYDMKDRRALDRV